MYAILEKLTNANIVSVVWDDLQKCWVITEKFGTVTKYFIGEKNDN